MPSARCGTGMALVYGWEHDREDQFAGHVQIVEVPGKHIGDPSRHPARVHERLGVSAEVVGFTRVPKIDLPALPGDRRPGQLVAGGDRAVQDQAREFLVTHPLQRILEARGPIRQDAQRLVEIPVRRGPRKSEPGAEPLYITPIPKSGQGEACLVERDEQPCSTARAASAPPRRKLPRDVEHQFTGDIVCANIGHDAEPFRIEVICGKSPSIMRSAFYVASARFHPPWAICQVRVAEISSVQNCLSVVRFADVTRHPHDIDYWGLMVGPCERAQPY